MAHPQADITPELVPIDRALALLRESISPLGGEPVLLERALGRFLSETVDAGLDLPPFTNSSMDGYAVRAQDTPGTVRVIGESAAGAPAPESVGPGEAMAISTGAVLPAGADAVAPVERVRPVGLGEIEVVDRVPPGAWIRAAGSDTRRGTPVLGTGERIGPAQIGVAAAIGLTELPCATLPRVAILTTGSELRRPGEALAEGEIYDANGPMLRAALSDAGAIVEHVATVPDSVEEHRVALARALEHDVVITVGGVSVGNHDLVRSVARELGVRERFWRIALRPGKPLSFGVRDETLVFGLPGNPVSALVCFEMFVRPALYGLQGARNIAPAFERRTLAVAVKRNPERDDLARVSACGAELTPLTGQESHQIAVAAQADGLARIPAGEGELPAGSEVAYLPLHRV